MFTITGGLFLLLGRAAAAEPPSAEALKAAIIYNIVRFVGFPLATAHAPLRLCTVRNVRGAHELSDLDGRRAGDRVIAVRTIDSGAVAGCDVIYVGAVATATIAAWRGSDALLIGDGTAFIEGGGMIGLVTMGSQTRFEINIGQARLAGLKVSSQLLRLATRVQE